MKFLIQASGRKVIHDFSFALTKAIEYRNWCNMKDTKFKLTDKIDVNKHEGYVPIGSVEFVHEYLDKFFALNPKPINVPVDLFRHPSFNFLGRDIINGDETIIHKLSGKWFVKSNDKLKSFAEVFRCDNNHIYNLPKGNYQYSNYIDIESEWRAFVYDGKLVGLQNYSGDFTKFPNVSKIKEMISAYKSAPIAYTLDVGLGADIHHEKYGFLMETETHVIEVHNFYSCGLYGFNDPIIIFMFHKWFMEYIKKNIPEDRFSKYKNSTFFKSK